MSRLTEFQNRAEGTARWLVVASAFVVPLPTAWVSLMTAGFLLAWLLSGRFSQRWAVIRGHSVATMSLVLLGWMALAIAWSPADFRFAVDHWWHYRELLLLPLMLSVVGKDSPTAEVWQRRILNAFLLGFGIALVASFLRWRGLLPEGHGGPYAGFGGHTGFSVMLAFVSHVCLQRFQSGTSASRWGWALLGVVCVGNLFLINTGRTGQVAFLALVPLALYGWIGWRGLLASALAVPVMAVGAYFASTTVHQRVNQTVTDIVGFKAGNADSNDGLRMDFWVHAVGFIREAPMLGVGTGGYATKYKEVAVREGLTGNRVSDNPHNEYLLIASQQGVIGLALFLTLWGVQWRGAGRLTPERRDLIRALLLVMASGDFFNSFILDNLEGHFYLVLTVALCAQLPQRRTSLQG